MTARPLTQESIHIGIGVDVIEAGNGFDGPTGSKFNSFLFENTGGVFVKAEAIDRFIGFGFDFLRFFVWVLDYSTIDRGSFEIIRFLPELLDDHRLT